MSETPQESKEIFTVYKQNVDKYFNEVERSFPQYLQSISNLQQAHTTAWKNTMESSILVQQEFANKIGVNMNVPPAFIKMINDATEEFIRMRTIQSKTILAMIDAVQQNIKMFNDNAKTFAVLNQNIIESWSSACTPA